MSRNVIDVQIGPLFFQGWRSNIRNNTTVNQRGNLEFQHIEMEMETKNKCNSTNHISWYFNTHLCKFNNFTHFHIYIYILYLQALAVHASHPIARRISTPKCTWSGSMSQTGSKNSPCCRLWAVRWWAWMGESVCYSCIGQLDSWRLDTTCIKR